MENVLTNDIQLNWLRTFAAAGKQLSFTLAAKELNMSQSAVSQQIQLLEHHLQQKLFVRANRSIQLTDAGRAFLPLVLDAIRELNSGAAHIFSSSSHATVDVNVNSTFAVLWLACRLSFFTAEFPDITIRQQGSNWSTDYDISTAELEVRYGSGSWAGFDSYRLVEGKIRPYCLLKDAEEIHKNKDFSTMVLLEVIGTPQGWDDWLKQHGYESLKNYQYQLMDSHATAVMMAANGAGVCLMYDDFMQEGIISEQLHAPVKQAIDSSGGYYLCHRSDKTLSDASRTFKQWLLSMVN